MDDQNKQSQGSVKYVCDGTCGGEVTEEQFNNGLTTCQTHGCTHFGKPFRRVAEGTKGPDLTQQKL